MSAGSGDGEIRLKQLAAYGLPAMPLAALALPLYVVVPTFYAANLGLSLAAVGTILLVIRILDAILDPAIGFHADRHRSRFGRRRGFFLLALPVAAFSTFMLFWPPQDAGLAYLFIWGALTSAGYTFAVLPHAAWGAELLTSYDGRARVSAWREGFTLAGTLVAIILPFAVGIGSAGGFHGLAALGCLVLVVLPLAGLLAVRGVPEPKDASIRNLPIGEGLRFLMANRPFLRLIAAFLLNGFANAVPATLFLYFVSARLGETSMQGPLLAAYFMSALAGVPLALLAARRLGKHRAWCIGMLVACLVFLFSGFLGTGDVAAFAIICVVTGVLLGFDLVLPPSIQADVIDQDTFDSGEQRSGLYFAAWALATKLAAALAVGLVLPLLALAGFSAAGNANSDTALSALSALYAWLPILPKLAAIALMWNFPLEAGRQAEIRAAIDNKITAVAAGS